MALYQRCGFPNLLERRNNIMPKIQSQDQWKEAPPKDGLNPRDCLMFKVQQSLDSLYAARCPNYQFHANNLSPTQIICYFAFSSSSFSIQVLLQKSWIFFL